MFSKLLLIVLTSAVSAAALLAIRHQRLESSHEASDIHQRLSVQERALWTMQDQIAEHCRPDAVRDAIEMTGRTWVGIPLRPPATPGGDDHPQTQLVQADSRDS